VQKDQGGREKRRNWHGVRRTGMKIKRGKKKAKKGDRALGTGLAKVRRTERAESGGLRK